MKRIIIVFLIGSMFPLKIFAAPNKCCSKHAGLCGCECCDGSPLDHKCTPYYSLCNKFDSNNFFRIPTNILKPSITSTPLPTPFPSGTPFPTAISYPTDIEEPILPTPLPTMSVLGETTYTYKRRLLLVMCIPFLGMILGGVIAGKGKVG